MTQIFNTTGACCWSSRLVQSWVNLLVLVLTDSASRSQPWNWLPQTPTVFSSQDCTNLDDEHLQTCDDAHGIKPMISLQMFELAIKNFEKSFTCSKVLSSLGVNSSMFIIFFFNSSKSPCDWSVIFFNLWGCGSYGRYL